VAGLVLRIATLMRGFPLLMIGYLLLRRRWRLSAYSLMGITFSGLLTISILGLSQTLSFCNGLRFVTRSRFLAPAINISLGAFVSRIYWYAFGAHGGPLTMFGSLRWSLRDIGLLRDDR
jgi:hypothetical protein